MKRNRLEKTGRLRAGKGLLHSPVPVRRRNWNFGLLSHPLRQRERAGGGAGHSKPQHHLAGQQRGLPGGEAPA